MPTLTRDPISNSVDIIDSRDVIARIEELQNEKDGADELDMDWSEIDAELAALRSLQEEAEGYSGDWKYGATLVRDTYFKKYAMELADDIGAINADASWPNDCIDWDKAARELQMDYTAVEFDGVTYWVR